MEIKNNQCFNINESDGLTKLKILNSALMKELRKYKEENTKLKHENEILNSIIENLEEENKALKIDFSSMKNQNSHEETMDIVENILQLNHEIKEEQLEYYDDHPNNEPNNDGMELASIKSLQDSNYKFHSCGQSFSQEQNLKKHSHENHEDHKDLKSEFCGSQSIQQAKFKCEICKKNFSRKYSLKVHIENVHEGLKKYECDKCNKKFTQNNDLKLHITTVHEKIKM